MNLLKLVIIIILLIFFLFFIKSVDRRFKIIEEGFDGKNKSDDNRIPKIIIQTWKNTDIPEKYKEDVASIKKMNPDFTYMLFTDKDIEEFLKTKYPQYYQTYKKLPVFIQKIDFFRYVAIYHYGGFYFDLDISAMKPLRDLLDHQCIFPIDLHLTPERCARKRFKPFCDKNEKIMIGQYAFGAKKKNSFVKKLIDRINDNIDKYIRDEKTDPSLNYVYQTTGPDFVTNMYLENEGKEDVFILYNKEGQYFGDYARHNHYGTWK